MGALRRKKNERHAAWECFRTLDVPDGSPKTGPQQISQTIILKYFLAFFKTPLGHPKRAHKKRPPQVDAKELQGQSHKTFIFRTYFAHVALRDPFGGRSQRALHFENKQTNIDFITFLTPSLSPTWGTKRNIKNCKTSATLHGSAPATTKTSATLHGSHEAS